MATAHTIYLGELRTQATHLQSGNQIITDAPVDNQGKGEAFSPTDLVATALGSCMLTIMGIVAEREGIELKGTELDVTKGMAANPRRINRVEVNLTVKTPVALTEEQQKKLENAAHTCPVAKSLHPDIEQAVTFNWQVEELV
ncbi:MAG: OsmC family protein [Siphonobacter sp.]